VYHGLLSFTRTIDEQAHTNFISSQFPKVNKAHNNHPDIPSSTKLFSENKQDRILSPKEQSTHPITMAPKRLDRTPEAPKLSSRLQVLISNFIYEILVYICVMVIVVFFLSAVTRMCSILMNLRGTCIELLGALIFTFIGYSCWLGVSLLFEDDFD
jgi:hypothetical protein